MWTYTTDSMDFVTVSTGLILPYWMGLPIRYIQKTVSLKEEGVEIFKNELESTLNDMLKMYSDIIILTDIPNATPYNECYRFKLSHEKDNIFILSGMNLAMAIELAIYSSSDMEVEELLTQVLETGKMSILKV